MERGLKSKEAEEYRLKEHYLTFEVGLQWVRGGDQRRPVLPSTSHHQRPPTARGSSSGSSLPKGIPGGRHNPNDEHGFLWVSFTQPSWQMRIKQLHPTWVSPGALGRSYRNNTTFPGAFSLAPPTPGKPGFLRRFDSEPTTLERAWPPSALPHSVSSFFLSVPGIELGTFHPPGRVCATELHPSCFPLVHAFSDRALNLLSSHAATVCSLP